MTSNRTPTRWVITGGGTGGHIYPALAVAEALSADTSVETVFYIGKTGSLESRVVPERGIAFEGIQFAGMPRRLTMAWFGWFWMLWKAFHESRRLLQRIRPHGVFGTGGYVSAPVLMAAASLGIPYVIHEPDAHPGLVNRLMGRWATTITGAFDAATAMLPADRFVRTGNPLRGDFGRLSKAEGLHRLGLNWPPEAPVLVVTGGSQGARTINRAVTGALAYLLNEAGLHVIHQAGGADAEAVQQTAQQAGYADHPNYHMQPFFADMAAVLACADVAVCRAGSMSLSELHACGVAAILVPYPYAAADHQRKNAMAVQQAGAARMILDADLTADTVCHEVSALLTQPGALPAMREASLSLAQPDATQQIVALLHDM